jgi:hypothetical protein
MGICLYLSLCYNTDLDRYLIKLRSDAANVTPPMECVSTPPLCACMHPGMMNNDSLVRVSILQNLLEAIKIYGGESP